MLGYARDLLGKQSATCTSPKTPSSGDDQEERRRAGESSQYQRRFRRADGSDLWVNVSASPILDDEGGSPARWR